MERSPNLFIDDIQNYLISSIQISESGQLHSTYINDRKSISKGGYNYE
jgi:hypothetical protein